MSKTFIAATLASAVPAHAQSLTLQIETGPNLADGVLSPGEVASFTVRAYGTAPPDVRYQAIAELFGFSMAQFGLGSFTHTGQSALLTLRPTEPGLLYDDAAGRIDTDPTGGFTQYLALLPLDVSNPVFLFSFDWTPSAFDGRTVSWTAAAAHGSVYYGGDMHNPSTWSNGQVPTIGPTSGSFIVAPAPGAASLIALTGLLAAKRRRRVS